MIVGVFGGLRTCELINMVFEDVVLEHGVYKVLITSSKTDPGGIPHPFSFLHHLISEHVQLLSCNHTLTVFQRRNDLVDFSG